MTPEEIADIAENILAATLGQCEELEDAIVALACSLKVLGERCNVPIDVLVSILRNQETRPVAPSA